ncbi:MAG: hypothetical protein HYU36_07965 [Planctomycetes bacterium]|nr:hypothetical protein [Planctomycetota bacterium]
MKRRSLRGLQRWRAAWDSEDRHHLEFELRGAARKSGEVVMCFRLKDFRGPQPCYVCSPEGILGARLALTLEERISHRCLEVLLGEGMNWHLGIKHHGFLMSEDDVWIRRRFRARHFAVPPGAYRLGLRFWFYEAGSRRDLLDAMRFGVQRYCPDSEGGASGYILYQIWDSQARKQEVRVPLEGPDLQVARKLRSNRLKEWRPDWKAALLAGKRLVSPPAGLLWHAAELDELPVDLEAIRRRQPPVRPPLRVSSSWLPHQVLAGSLKPGDPDLDAILYRLTGKRIFFHSFELHQRLRAREITQPDFEECLLVGREALSVHYACKLLGRRQYLRPHYELWRQWEYRPPRFVERWPMARPELHDLRLWFENRRTGDVDISTTNFHTAGAAACWLCGHAFGDEKLMDIGRRDLMENVIRRQEADGFWPYATDRWAGEEGYHLHAMSELLPLLDFEALRKLPEFMRAIERGLDYNLAHFTLGDGSYLGTPWHAPYPERGNPARRGYQLAFTLYMIDGLAAAIRWLGRDLEEELGRSIRWVYRRFSKIMSRPSQGTRHIPGFVLRPLLLLPLVGFRFEGRSLSGLRVRYAPEEDRVLRFS